MIGVPGALAAAAFAGWLAGFPGSPVSASAGAAQLARPRHAIVKSPDGHVAFELDVNAAGGMRYRVLRDTATVVDWSKPGIVIDGVEITDGVSASDRGSSSSTNATYPVHGVHAMARDRSNDERIHLEHAGTHTRFTLEVRAFDDGIGFRFVVPGAGTRTPDEATTFQLPPGSITWTHDLHGHYEATYVRRTIEDVPTGDWAAPPLTYKLPGGGGYASITESALTGYAGMALQATGRNGYAARLGHAHPVSYPYALRYPAEEVVRLARPAAIDGPVITPWRVVIAGADLNALVNNDIVRNLAPPPDPALFPRGPDTEWIRTGRAVWRYLDGGDNTYEGLMTFTDLAAKLGFEHHVVEGVWRQWTPEQLGAFVAYARARNVGIWLWKHSRELQTPDSRRTFFELCQRNGVVGVKVDFFDHEAKDVVDLYTAILREGARYRLMFDFHGANKPTGLDRTFPNELTREAVYGFEHRGTAPWGPHNATVPFTRLLAGSADYTPTVFGDRRRETSWTHQIATAVVFTSALLVYGGHPQSFLDSPAAAVIRTIPATWDETIVLAPSEIGEVAVMARRKGKDWYLAAVNGGEPRTVRVPLSFLGAGTYRATIIRDDASNAAAVRMEEMSVSSTGVVTFNLLGGGGFLARFGV